ncbi:hypothetical protein C8A03DRAFT_20052, partial [Achaetomium macrosporum]
LWRSSAVISLVTAVLCMHPLLYVASRIIMIAEAFTGLRPMKAGIYETYVIWNYGFHFH